MSNLGVTPDVIQFIHRYSRPELFEELPILIGQAFRQADEESRNSITHCDLRQSRKRSQDRYFYVQEALCETRSGWIPLTMRTANSGESYTQLEADYLLATIHIPPWSDGKIRRAKYREQNATLNVGIYEQFELDLGPQSNYRESKSLEKLNILIIAQAPHPSQQQDLPTQIKVLVPFENNQGYHLDISIDDLVSGFDTAQSTTEPVDEAWPKLRTQMRQAESNEQKE